MLSGHSFRVGGAQYLRKIGSSELETMLWGGWQNIKTMAGYLR